MNSDTAVSPKAHYHIRWLRSGELDWERHDTRPQAEQAAQELSRPGEEYSVERFEEACVKCRQTQLCAQRYGDGSSGR